MTEIDEWIKKLHSYLERRKSSDPYVWEKRGLIPSPAETVERMEALVNCVGRAALESILANKKPALVRKQMLLALRGTRSSEFDTEEREFLCAEVASIASLAGVSVGEHLNVWLYGWGLGMLYKVANALRGKEVVVATFYARCSGCQSDIAVEVTKKRMVFLTRGG
jgi:hypothetical protein